MPAIGATDARARAEVMAKAAFVGVARV